MNKVKDTKPVALTVDEDGKIVKIPLCDDCGLPPVVWNRIADRVLLEAESGKLYPLDPMDVYQTVVKKVLERNKQMPELEKASAATYLTEAINYAFLDIVKEIISERANQTALIDNPQPSELADLDAEILPLDSPFRKTGAKPQNAASTRQTDSAAIPMLDHNYAPLYKAIASLRSKRMKKAAIAYLDPQVDGNLFACAAAAGVRKSRFYASFWPATLNELRKLLEAGETTTL